jgi:DNA-binding NtrC family response regulator
VKLLRAIQEGEVEPVGARKPVKVNVRLMSATNRDLIEDVKQGRFREDLFYRLHVFPISVPPLCERPEDIPELARHFLARFAAEEGKRITRLAGEALSLLSTYQWPGNVRQLENAVFRAVVLAEREEVGLDDFPQIAAQMARTPASGAQTALQPGPGLDVTADEGPSLDETLAETVAKTDLHQSGSIAPQSMRSPAPPDGATALCLLDPSGEVRPLEELENEIIRFAIAHYRGQMSEVARKLQIGRSTLYRKLDHLGLGTHDSPDLGQDPVVAE